MFIFNEHGFFRLSDTAQQYLTVKAQQHLIQLAVI